MSDQLKRSIIHRVRYRPAEMEAIEQAAALEQEHPVEWVRKLTVGTAKQRVQAAAKRQ